MSRPGYRRPSCTFDGCSTTRVVGPYCRLHDRIVNHPEITPRPWRYGPDDACLVPGCDGRPEQRHLCRAHVSIGVRHRLSPETVARLWADPRCQICGTTERLHIDHEHGICGDHHPKGSCDRCVRGLLCQPCNLGIGQLGDDPDRLIAAAAYLLESRPVRADNPKSAPKMRE